MDGIKVVNCAIPIETYRKPKMLSNKTGRPISEMLRQGNFPCFDKRKIGDVDMSPKVTFYKNVADVSGKMDYLPIILIDIKSGKWERQITELRSIQNENTQKTYKNTLPCFTGSGVFAKRATEGLLAHSDVLIIDLDIKDNPRLLKNFDEIRSKLIADKHTYFLFTSCRGNGIAVGMKIDGAQHLKTFKFLEHYCLEKYGLTIDKGCKDVTRLRFISYDPDLYYANGSTQLVIVPEGFLKVSERRDIKPPPHANGNNHEFMRAIIASGKLLGDDSYESWIREGLALVGEFGKEGRGYFHELSKVSPKYDAAECDKKYDNCLKTNRGEVNFGTIVHMAREVGVEFAKNAPEWITQEKTVIEVLDLIQKRRHSKKGKPIFEPLLEVEIFKQDKHLIFLNEQIRMYKDGWYQPFDDRYYLKLIELQIGEFLNGRRGVAKEILETLKDSLHKKEQPANINPRLINVKNGLFNIETGLLLIHSPDYIYTYQINANYDSYATCPTFEKFLSEILIDEETLAPDEELLLLMQQFTGYCLYPATPFHESLIFYGDGRNGKGILVFTISDLFPGLVSKVHFEDIGVDRFATADLAGKLVNISSEFGANAQLHDGQIKAIIAGDELRAQRKHQQPFDFRPFAKHIITTNNLPRSRDSSLGFFSRFMIVPFHRTFLKQEEIDILADPEFKSTCSVRDPFLEEKLKQELDGIFLWAVNGLKTLLDERGFCNSRQVQKYRDIFKIRSSSVEVFCKDRLKEDCLQNIESKTLYRAYIASCRDINIPPESNKKFVASLRNLGYEVTPGTDNVNVVRGVSLLL